RNLRPSRGPGNTACLFTLDTICSSMTSPSRICSSSANASAARDASRKADSSSPPTRNFESGSSGWASSMRSAGATWSSNGLRICSACGKRWFLPKCSCGGHTTPRNGPARQRVPIAEVLRTALERLGEPKPSEIKAVQGMISKNKTPEPIEKGVLRAKHEIYVFKDGTTRFDMTNLPLTHFTPREAGISVEEARGLGYARDMMGRPLEREE